MSSLTIGQTVAELHCALRDYIEAAYHVSNPAVVQQRRLLLDQPGVIHQLPYLESTPRYLPGPAFEKIEGLPSAVLELFSKRSAVTGKPLFFNPPYSHQATSVRECLVKGQSLVVMTGTGSGKTECFLLPILGKLATEAKTSSSRFRDQLGVRALILYPMNALVNDQLGRLRLLLGDPAITSQFKAWAGRPARFARYTSRTLYPGVRDPADDSARLKPLRDFYVEHERRAVDANLSQAERERSQTLVNELKSRGKWPAKPSISKWFGEDKSRWRDSKTGEYLRCVVQPDDAELLTRHEVQDSPPDVLITNYSMLEYMLMRPIERPIFDRTREWLAKNPEERFLLVVDEAHLYRGAAGAEVSLLIRRLRMRLGIPPERLQVICTSASFNDPDHAIVFGSQLTGKPTKDFAKPVRGELHLRQPEGVGSALDAEALAAVDFDALYNATTDDQRIAAVRPLLDYRRVKEKAKFEQLLWKALADFPPMLLLINLSMKEAMPVSELGGRLFSHKPRVDVERAVTALIALGSLARQDSDGPNLLPCRVHAFFRGLPGLWACMDSNCSALKPEQRGGPIGKLYGQPQDVCACGARVLEFFTCRNCGTAYARAYTDEVESPAFLWRESGRDLRVATGELRRLAPIDILLERPVSLEVEPVDYDLVTGRINPEVLGERTRQLYLKRNRSSVAAGGNPVDNPGEFRPCGVCAKMAAFGRTYVQDHQTKGDQPFESVIVKQLQVQPPNPGVPATTFAPLQGRKVLIFSDSRQVAARLAPRLQSYSLRDALRPLIVYGFRRLAQHSFVSRRLSLEDLYFAVLIAAAELAVRLRPTLKGTESFNEYERVRKAVSAGILEEDEDLEDLMIDVRTVKPPESLLELMFETITDDYYGFESLALGTLCERNTRTKKLRDLPTIGGIAETEDQKLALARIWLNGWQPHGFWLSAMPEGWKNIKVKTHSGEFRSVQSLLGDKDRKAHFSKEWLPALLETFADPVAGKHRLKGNELSLELGGVWAYCQRCRTTQRPFPGSDLCRTCSANSLNIIDPDEDPVFRARKGYYRAAVLDVMRKPPAKPIAFVAAEHTAQLNAPQSDEVFSDAEENELLFQDVQLEGDGSFETKSAIDVLSCTTTMEVGIDIGKLSGVALRNMPPARANYQQRSGRAGRRGNAVATVVAFGSADSHDEEYFTRPDQMIRGEVRDPTLTLDNVEIAQRHVLAYLLQRYHQERIPDVAPEEQPQLFAVLGTVEEFLNPESQLSRANFEQWLDEHRDTLRGELDQWLPHELANVDRTRLLDRFVEDALFAVDTSLADMAAASPTEGKAS